MENNKDAAMWQLVDAEMTEKLSEIERLQMAEDAISQILCEEYEVKLSISAKLADWLVQDGYTVTRLDSYGMCKITY